MRIVGGALRGRALSAPRSQAIRPTSDRLRESVFDILAHRFDDPVTDANVIDLFAGTGALGLEALSRGAKRALFVDDGSEARALLRANIDALGLDHAAFGRNRPKADNVIDSNSSGRALREKPVPAFSQRAPGGVTCVFRRDATKLGAAPSGETFSLAFLDPPYGKGLAGRALVSLIDGGWLAPRALVVIEEVAGADIALPAALTLEDHRRYGDTQFIFARLT